MNEMGCVMLMYNYAGCIANMSFCAISRHGPFCKGYHMHDTQQDRTYDEPNKQLGCQ
jgi:hypothetical protein